MSDMKWKVVVESECARRPSCSGSKDCPTVYQLDGGDFAFRGYKIADMEKAALDIPPNEDVVRLPAEFVEAVILSLKR